MSLSVNPEFLAIPGFGGKRGWKAKDTSAPEAPA